MKQFNNLRSGAVSTKLKLILVGSVIFLSQMRNSLTAQVAGDYRSAVATGSWSNATSWETYDGATWIAASTYPQYNVGNAVTILSGHNITVDVSPQLYIKQTTVALGGTITVPTAITLWVFDGTGTDLTVAGNVAVTGTLKTNSGAPAVVVSAGGTITVNTGGSVQIAAGGSIAVTGSILNTGTVTNSGTLTFNSGGTYQHNINGGTVPTSTWGTGSICSITGTTTTVPSGLTQSFHHLTWNTPSMSSNLSLGGNLTTVNGNLTFTSTGTGAIRLRLFSGATGALNVGGNLILNAASAQPTVSGSSTATTATVNVSGDLVISAGTLYLSDNNGTGAVLNAAGNFSMTGGAISAGAGRGTVNFNKAGTQTFSRSSGSIGTIDMAVLSGSLLDMGTSTVNTSSSLNFILNAGAGLQTASTTGVLGNITNTGTKTLSSSANYIFNGASAQVTSAFVTTPTASTVNNLTINNANGVILSSALAVNGAFTLATGSLTTGANNLTLGAAATASLEAGTVLKITGGSTDFAGRPATLKSNASGTASIGTITGDNITTGLLNATNVTTQVYIPGGRRTNRFLSHPFTSALNMASLIDNMYITGAGAGFDPTGTNNPSAFWYDNAVAAWTAFTSTTDNSWTQYRGIRALIRGNRYQPTSLTGGNPVPNADTLDMTGSLNLGNANIVLGASGYYVVGNPYPSPVDIGTVIDAAANTGNQYWVWDANGGVSSGSYTTRLTTAGGGGGAYNLAMNGAFVIQLSGASTLAFTELKKTASATSNLFRTQGKSNLLELQLLYNGNSIDNLFVRKDAQSATGKEQFDGEKLINPDLNFYTLSTDNQKLSLDTRPFNEGTVIQLGLATTKQNVYKIKVADYGFDNNMELYLNDRFNNTLTKLDAAVEYDFAVTANVATQGESRFELVMKKAPLPLIMNNDFVVSLSPNPVKDMVKVSFNNTAPANTTITMSNAEGKIVKTVDAGNVQSGQVSINVKSFAKGSYYVTLNNGKERKTEKLQVQ